MKTLPAFLLVGDALGWAIFGGDPVEPRSGGNMPAQAARLGP